MDATSETFEEEYKMLKYLFGGLSTTLIVIKTFVGIGSSLKTEFDLSSTSFIIGLILMFSFLSYFDKASQQVKKVNFVLSLELTCLYLRWASIKLVPEFKMLLCIKATVFVLLFELPVFKSQYSIIFMLIKHFIIWYYIDFEATQSISLNNTNYYAFIVTTATILLTYHYDCSRSKSLKEKTKELHSNKSDYNQVINILQDFPDSLVILNKSFEVLFSNKAMLGKIKEGVDFKEFILDTINIHTEASVLKLLKEYFDDCEESSEKSFGIFLVNNKHFEIRVHKVFWQQQACCILTIRDIGQILQHEILRIENRCKNLLIRSLSHEFRTPINCVSLIIDEIKSSISNLMQERLENAQSCLKLLTFQLNDVMDYSNLIIGKFTSVKSETNLKFELKNLIKLIKTQADYKNVKAFTNIDETLPESIRIDWYRIQKVIINLLTNALKYTSKGSIELFAKNKGKVVTIGVKDTGIGIPASRLSQICNMFTDHTNFSLSGLGLNICQKILAQFNSKLQIKSDHGGGSVFKFDLLIPILKAHSTNDHISDTLIDPEIPSEELSRSLVRVSSCMLFDEKNPQVLVVDDTEFSRMCLGNLLKAEFIEYVEACNGQEAVDIIVSYDKVGVKIGCVIMDCNMPVMDGWEACIQLKQMYSQGKISYFPYIIGYTAFDQDSDINKCFEVGMTTYINKPSTKDKIISVIQKYI